MSYDLWLEIDTGSGYRARVYEWTFTSSASPMWRHAGADLAGFDGKTAAECTPILDAAVRRMLADPGTYRSMDAPNGWGTYDQLMPHLAELLRAMQTHPATTVGVWR